MATEKQLSVLALYVYRADVDRINEPLLTGWQVLQDRTDGSAGFAYAVFRNSSTNEIVISFRGSDDSVDWLGNAGLSISQERQAALVYTKVLREHDSVAQGGNISFAGHSLGGGLAATMAVWFNRPATVFDPAPTQRVATDLATVNSIIGALGTSAPQSIKDYAASVATQFAVREHKSLATMRPARQCAPSVPKPIPLLAQAKVTPFSLDSLR